MPSGSAAHQTAHRFPWHRLYIYVGVALLLAAASRYVAYAAILCYSGIRGVEVQDRKAIADEVSLVVGCLALIGVFVLLAAQT
jgi:hypothetical protein